MSKKLLLRLILLNGAIALINIIFFSRSLLGITFSLLNPLRFSLAVTVAAMSLIIFIIGNYKLLKPSEREIKAGVPELESLENYLPLIKDAQKQSLSFRPLLVKVAELINSFINISDKIDDLLLQHFNPSEMSYARFYGAVKALEEIAARNVRRVLKRTLAFDDTEFCRLQSATSLTETQKRRLALYSKSLVEAEQIAENNCELLLKLEMLLIELSKLGEEDLDGSGASNAMEEIDALIKSAKLYG